MRLFARAQQEVRRSEHFGTYERHECDLSASRLLNSAARLMSSFQDGLATLHKLRNGGKQVVTVQHVQVKNGGQAVVAGNLRGSGGGPKGEGDVEN